MADDLTARHPFIDLTVTGARTIRADGFTRIYAIRVRGTAGAAVGDFTLRHTTATTGPILFKQLAAIGSEHDGTLSFGSQGIMFDKIFMDNLANAWTAGSHLMLYTSEAL